MTLKQIIQASGLKQSYIALNIGVTENVLSNLVSGRRRQLLLSDQDMIAALANLLQRPEAEILAAYDETRKAKC